MAVFEYRGVLVATGKAGQGRPRRGEPEGAPRVAPQRDGILLTAPPRSTPRKAKATRNIDLSRSSAASAQRRRDDDAPARDPRSARASRWSSRSAR